MFREVFQVAQKMRSEQKTTKKKHRFLHENSTKNRPKNRENRHLPQNSIKMHFFEHPFWRKVHFWHGNGFRRRSKGARGDARSAPGSPRGLPKLPPWRDFFPGCRPKCGPNAPEVPQGPPRHDFRPKFDEKSVPLGAKFRPVQIKFKIC